MPFDPEEFRTRMQLDNILFRAETELENSLVFAVVKKARGIDEAGMHDQVKPTLPDSQYQPPLERPISIPVAPPCADIDRNILRARISYNPVWFLERLAPGGEMDYKQGAGNNIFEDIGNFNYGAVALAFGLSQNIALRGAGLVQILVDTRRMLKGKDVEGAGKYVAEHGLDFLGDAPYGDQQKDQEMIKQGFRYYKEVYLTSKSPNNVSEEGAELREMFGVVVQEELDSFLRSPKRISDIFFGE